MVGVQRGGPVIVQSIKAHQLRVGRFMERIVAQQRLGMVDGLPVVAPRLIERHQLLLSRAVRLGQPVPLEEQPIAVAARQQLAPVCGHRLFEHRDLLVCLRTGSGTPQCSLERGHIEPALVAPAPLHCECIHHQEAIGFRQGPAQSMPEVAEVGAGLLFRGIGPEGEGQLLARHPAAAMQQDVG